MTIELKCSNENVDNSLQSKKQSIFQLCRWRLRVGWDDILWEGQEPNSFRDAPMPIKPVPLMKTRSKASREHPTPEQPDYGKHP